MSIFLSKLYRYPVKSLSAAPLESASLLLRLHGLQVHGRAEKHARAADAELRRHGPAALRRRRRRLLHGHLLQACHLQAAGHPVGQQATRLGSRPPS